MTSIVSEALQVRSHNQYQSNTVLSPQSVAPSPFDQFRTWFKEAQENDVKEPEAMAISTVSAAGVPSSRMVLFRQLDERGFVFFTNYTSRKSQELASNPNASIVFYWREINRQVRVVGKAERVSREESKDYFKSRPVGSQLGAWASKQSSVVEEGEVNARQEKLEARFTKGDGSIEVPHPDFWGGWRIIPSEIEFWAGKPSRLHDRVRYLSVGEGDSWKIDRLAP